MADQRSSTYQVRALVHPLVTVAEIRKLQKTDAEPRITTTCRMHHRPALLQTPKATILCVLFLMRCLSIHIAITTHLKTESLLLG